MGIIMGNYEKSLEFYRDVMGFKLLDTADWGDYILYTLELPDGGRIELSDFGLRQDKASQDRQAVGYRHIAFEVEDVDAWAQYLKEKEICIPLEPRDYPLIKARCMLCQDPDGVEIELFQYL